MAEGGIDLSVCVVAGPDERENLSRLLSSLRDQAGRVECEALVAETVAETVGQGLDSLADEFAGLAVVRLGGLTMTAAVNRLLALSRGRYLLLLPVSAWLGSDCPQRLVDFMDEAPEIGLVGPRLLDPEGREIASGAEFPWLFRLARLPWPWPLPVLMGRTGEVDFCLGGCHLLRREALEEIGGLKAGGWGRAELDLYWRARRLGWHNCYLREAVVRVEGVRGKGASLGAGFVAIC